MKKSFVSGGARTSYLGHCLVTGAAGFVGSHLVKALLQRGLRVRALVRNTPLVLQHDRLECFSGDIQNAQQMLQACEGIDTVFHTAAMIATLGGSAVTARYREQAYAINVTGTNNVIRGCQAQAVGRLIHTSSIDTCFNGEEDLHMDEHTSYATRLGCVYQETKISAEQSVLAAKYPGRPVDVCVEARWYLGRRWQLDARYPFREIEGGAHGAAHRWNGRPYMIMCMLIIW